MHFLHGTLNTSTSSKENYTMAYTIDPETCAGCGSCESECPNEAISHKKKLYKIDPDVCTECEGLDGPTCVSLCMNDAISKLVA